MPGPGQLYEEATGDDSTSKVGLDSDNEEASEYGRSGCVYFFTFKMIAVLLPVSVPSSAEVEFPER